MNPYFMLVLSLAIALFSASSTKLFLSKYNQSESTRFLYQSVSTGVSVVMLVILNGAFKISTFTLLLGLAFGALTATQTVFSMKSMQTGPWSYSSMISSLSTIIPTLSGAVIWNEKIAPAQIAGICLMFVCIFLSSDLKKGGNKANVRWLIYCGITFLCTGFIGVLQKLHQNTQYKGELNEFLIVAFIVSFVFSIVMTVIETQKQKRGAALLSTQAIAEGEQQSVEQTQPQPAVSLRSVLRLVPILTMFISGVGVALNNKFNLYLSGVLDSSFLFPILNGGGLMLTTLAATLFFKERLSWKQWVGLGVGLIAVILLCNPF